MNIIETNALTKKYGEITAVDNLNLKIKEGEIFGLLGPNGAGKTTTLMMLTTLRKPTSGTATVNGFDIVKEADNVRKSIGIVFQDPSTDDILTGYENLKLHGMLYGMDKILRERRIKEVLELVGLTERKDSLVRTYSGGMRRRLEIARGLMHHPKVLFLDEPTLGLDPQSREQIWDYIRKLSKEEKITIVLTTHYMEEAELLCDRVAIIDYGKIVALDSPKNLKKVIGGDVVTIKTNLSNFSKIKKLNFVKKIKKVNSTLTLTIIDSNKNLPKLLKVIGKVNSVEIHSPTLHDVFLYYTGRKIREEEPEGGWFERTIHVNRR